MLSGFNAFYRWLYKLYDNGRDYWNRKFITKIKEARNQPRITTIFKQFNSIRDYNLNEIYKKRVLIISQCGKSKAKGDLPAYEKYNGQVANYLKSIWENNENFDLRFLSGKFGLVNAYTRIPDYDQKINTKADIERVRGISKDKLEFLTKIYGKIFLVMGKKYRNVLEPSLDDSGKFYVLIEEKGIFAWNKVLSQFAELSEKELLRALENYRLIKSNVNPNIQKIIEVLKK